MTDHWAIMPWRNAPEMTWQAVEDLLAQSLPGVRVLLIDQGASQADREWIDAAIDKRLTHPGPPFNTDPEYTLGRGTPPRVLCWHYLPALPSLSAVWNRALRFVWELGGTEALVVNNDVRLHPRTYELLDGLLGHTPALFVSAVGVREGQFDPSATHEGFLTAPDAEGWGHPVAPGGPDFSCFLLSQAGHRKYPFDEGFIPAYHEDLDMHRRYMLGGDGDKIFSVNLPFLHYASGTIKEYTPEQRAKFNAGFQACKAYYTRKWGPPNAEVFYTPFGEGEAAYKAVLPVQHADLPVTTPDLQRYWQVARRPTDV
jgi:hypothetical protein